MPEFSLIWNCLAFRPADLYSYMEATIATQVDFTTVDKSCLVWICKREHPPSSIIQYTAHQLNHVHHDVVF